MSKRAYTIFGFDDRRLLSGYLMDQNLVPDLTRVTFSSEKHTSAQRIRFHAMVGDLAKQATHNGRKYDPVQWKAIILQALGQEIEFLPTLDGKSFFPIGFHTSEFSKEQMSDAIELVFAWGTEHGVKFKDPEKPPPITEDPRGSRQVEPPTIEHDEREFERPEF
jgi:hypothetical protein